MYRRPALRRSLKPCTAERDFIHGLGVINEPDACPVNLLTRTVQYPVSSGFWTDVQLSVAGFTMDAKSATETIS